MRRQKHWKLPAAALAALALIALAAGVGAATEDPKPTTAWLGVSLADLDAELAEVMNVPEGEGALVNEVIDDSPAEKAGLEDGDAVVRFAGRRIADASDLTRAVRDAKPGETVKIVIFRDGKEKELDVTLGETKERRKIVIREDAAPCLKFKEFEDLDEDSDVLILGEGDDGAHPFAWTKRIEPRAWMGTRLSELTEQLGGYFGVDSGEGALVQEVEPDSPAQAAGLRAGDVIVRVGGETVAEPADVIEALRDVEPGETLEVAVVRDRAERALQVKLGESPGARAHAEILKKFQEGELPRKRALRIPDDAQREVFIRRMGPQAHQELEKLHQEMQELKEQLRQLRHELQEKG